VATRHPRHFVAYHNADKFGRYRVSKSNADREHTFWTAKSFKNDMLIGQYIWAFEGVGSPKRYSLVAVGEISKITKQRGNSRARLVHFEAASNDKPIDVTDFDWFKALLKQQQSFRNGLNRIADRDVIRSLKALVAPNRKAIRNRGKLTVSIAASRDAGLGFARLVPQAQTMEVVQSLSHSIESIAPARAALRGAMEDEDIGV
jgi:hypothetical protein